MKVETTRIDQLDVALNRDVFLRDLVRQLADVLEDIVGVEQAAGFISVVGQRVADWINEDYRHALKVNALSRDQIAQVLVDLKRRIQGDFYIVEQTDTKIALGNRACPFAEKVLGHPSLCMMTSNVFGVIAAENIGYAKVNIETAIATGAKECRVVVSFEPTDGEGREYYKASR